ncbi:hypothetical protein LCGC14_0905120 [marine sediment metagenome]|uniref:PseI/NeuA/B-like domain-containing protein n=1 Tax=marine sediment metagenome TaxID=412755 RepID=A0A0F9NVA9_9ZZZZ
MVMVIAEAGVNHNGDAGVAFRLTEAAVRAGADAVKFQTYDAEKLEPPGERREMMQSLQLSRKAHRIIKKDADLLGIEFISTPFDVDSLKFLVEEIGVKTLKIASGNLDNKALISAAADFECRVILSTGMATISEVRHALLLRFFQEESTLYSHSKGVCLLHCTSAYPTPLEDVNLKAMVAMGADLTKPVGLSDHTQSLVIPAAAVAMGAVVIEKHLTLDRNMDGPDHQASLEPDEFAEMVRNIREVEKALGDGVKVPRECEAATMKVIEERKAWRER